METVEIIRKKRDGKELTSEEIRYLIQGYTNGQIPDYQMSAWTMAVFFQGMSDRETADLTLEMAKSGDLIDLSAIHKIKVDKHSTGGVGDKTTLVVGPLVAATGVPVPKLSGRGLGHTGGTIDKLESIPGFTTSLSMESFVKQINDIQIAIMSQTARITPADKQLYALRDVTATVDCIPLIASSIMSKKIAVGSDRIVLDVKTGSGAFMKDEKLAIQLAQKMVEIGKHVGRQIVAVISDMNQPLGFAIGNALEVKEAIDTLKGRGPADLTELCLTLGAQMIVLADKVDSVDKARLMLKEKINNGSALHKFLQFIQAQGGDIRVVEDPYRSLPQAKFQKDVISPTSGIIASLDAEEIGLCAMQLGAGRETKDSQIDPSVGIRLQKKVGDRVEKGEVLAVIHANDEAKVEKGKQRFLQSILFTSNKVVPPPKSGQLLRSWV